MFVSTRCLSSMFALLLIAGCKPDPDGDLEDFPNYVPGFTVVADSGDRVERPQDLEFHPNAARASELWVVNKGIEDTGSSMVIVHDAGKSNQEAEYRIDDNAWHFMNLTSAIAFSDDNENWASSPEITDANHAGGTFTGPTLWSSNLDVFARPSGGNGSHIDMLHQSPNSMGIAHEVDNIFWVFDGFNSELVRYNFVSDHGPGNADHDDGRVRHYSGMPIERVENNPSHLVLDKSTDWLYVCDTANGQVLRLNITSGSRGSAMPPTNEVLAANVQWEGETWEVFATGLDKPSGIALGQGLLYVSDSSTNEIVGYALETGAEIGRIQTPATKILGIEVGPDGNLWYVDRGESTVVRIDQN